ncbi:hypothetical protein MMC10_005448 [Thelotrema lepadinum]|nr:hypothetical protein [Thelotrema lepadinum]
MDNCQEQNIQPGDWVYKDFPVPATGVAAKVSAPVSDSYPVQHRREYQGLDSYRLISASENTLSPTMEWQANATVPDASMPMPFQGPVSQATQEQAALMPALNFASAQHNSLLSYGRVTPHTGMAVYPGTSNHGMVSAPGVTPVPGNVSVSESVAAPHGLPIQQGFSINGSMPVPYAQGLTGQFGPALVQQGDNSVGFSDQRRVSSSTENTSYSDQIGYNNGEMQDLSERQAYGGQYQMYGNGVQPYREGFGSFGDASGLSGDGSQSPLPDMTCSDPPSPAEIEDNLPVYFEDFGIKEDDANGIPLPNQYFNNMA